MKRCSMSLIIREMPVKTMMRYYLTPVRVTTINKSTNNNCCLGLQIGAATVETVWRLIKMLKIELPYDSAISLQGIYPKKSKTMIQTDI